MAAKTLTYLLQSFLTVALPQRGSSPLTVLSYRDALKLLLRFASRTQKRPSVLAMKITDISGATVREFLQHLEESRGNGISTRNNRLAAIRSFFTFVAGEEPSLAEHCQHVCAVPMKRAPVPTIPYLEQDEMNAILEAPRRGTLSGRRDHAILLFLYNSGARVQELVGVRPSDLQLVRPAQVRLFGKGRKERVCPLWNETAVALRDLLDEAGCGAAEVDGPVFRNARGAPISRFGVDHIVKKYAQIAARRVASLTRKRVSPHVLRHTAAVHLLNAGVDVNVIRAWLGHVDVRTTSIYAEINLATKRKALETCAPTTMRAGRRRPTWQRDPDVLTWLEQL